MFKTEVVNSRNIQKTVFAKILYIFLIFIIFFLIFSHFNLWGEKSQMGTFLQDVYSNFFRYIAIGIIILGVILSIIMKSRMKNPNILGSVEIDESELRFISVDNQMQTFSWENI
jgi:hypothetical protein